MKNNLIAPLVIISILFISGCCYSARLLQNDLFIAPPSPPSFDQNLNSVADGNVEKDAVLCHEDNRPWSRSSSSFNEINKLSFKLRPTVQNKKNGDELPASNEAKRALNSIPKDNPSHKVDSLQITEQRLSTSSNSPGVGHMQMIRHKSNAGNIDIFKSNHSSTRDDRL